VSEANQRQFDWGPPASAGDGLKEWLLYVLILALLGAGVWVLLDINGQKAPPPVAPQPVTEVSRPVEAPLVAPSDQAPVQPLQPTVPDKFYVQLGAFADEASAREVFNQLTADGFSPTLAVPDEQYEIHRVLVGPFNSESEAEEKAGQLNVLGLHCFVTESP